MRRREVRLSHQSREDLDRIEDPLRGEVMRRLRLLAQFPQLGTPLEEALIGWRSTVVSPFRIIYRVAEAGPIEVAYIRHCRRSSPDLP